MTSFNFKSKLKQRTFGPDVQFKIAFAFILIAGHVLSVCSEYNCMQSIMEIASSIKKCRLYEG